MKQIDTYDWTYKVLERIADVTDTTVTEVLDNIIDEWLDNLDEETIKGYGL